MPESSLPTISTLPSDGVCRIALTTRLPSARPNSAESTNTGSLEPAEAGSRTPLARASGSALVSTSLIRSPSPTSRQDSRNAPA